MHSRFDSRAALCGVVLMLSLLGGVVLSGCGNKDEFTQPKAASVSAVDRAEIEAAKANKPTRGGVDAGSR